MIERVICKMRTNGCKYVLTFLCPVCHRLWTTQWNYHSRIATCRKCGKSNLPWSRVSIWTTLCHNSIIQVHIFSKPFSGDCWRLLRKTLKFLPIPSNQSQKLRAGLWYSSNNHRSIKLKHLENVLNKCNDSINFQPFQKCEIFTTNCLWSPLNLYGTCVNRQTITMQP